MNKLLTALFALAVACVTGMAQAQAPQNTAPAQPGAKSIEAKVAMCVGCHGIKGYQATFPEVYKVPMISGQSARYIAAALTAYKNGDRKHPTMRGIATSLSEQDVNDIAAYYEASGKEAGAAIPDKANREPSPEVTALLEKALQQKVACVSCHGANFSKPSDPSSPRIAGQHADYMFAALKAYKTENNPSVGRNNGVMGMVAKKFSNAELKALAGYVSSLDSELKTKPESKFR
jgi:cytochrome c553